MQLPYREADTLAKSHKCKCNGELVVATDPSAHGRLYIVRCGKCGATEEGDFELRRSYYQQWKRGELGNPYIINRLKKMEEQDMNQQLVEQVGPEKALALAPYQSMAVITEEDAKYILNVLWPNAPEAAQKHAALLCKELQISPLRKQIVLAPFRHRDDSGNMTTTWEPILEIGANRELASRKGHYSYKDRSPRLLPKTEAERYFDEVDEDHVYAITIVADPQGGEYIGVGMIRKWATNAKRERYQTTVIGADKGNTHANMAMIRSERKALDRYCGSRYSALLEGVQTMDGRYIETPSGSVDASTGEIVEGEGRIMLEEAQQQTEEPAREPDALVPGAPPGDGPRRTPEQVDFIFSLAKQKGQIEALKSWLERNDKTFETMSYPNYKKAVADLQALPEKGKELEPEEAEEPLLSK